MSFTQTIKRDMLKNIPEERCCKLALLNAILTTSGRWNGSSYFEQEAFFSFTCEDESVASYVLGIVYELFQISMDVTEAVRDPKKGRDKLTFTYTGERAEEIVSEILSQGLYRIGDPFRQCCAEAYLKGAFLGSGSCTLPRNGAKTGYHLEFVFKVIEDAEFFCELLDHLNLMGSVVSRADRYIVYCKNREGVGDFLSVVSANSALRTFEQVSAAREESNNRNRVENCTAGNVDRSLTASVEQVRALRELWATEGFGKLSDSLRETALARIANPTLSYSELAWVLGISKSCLQHRIQKLMQTYEGETE